MTRIIYNNEHQQVNASYEQEAQRNTFKHFAQEIGSCIRYEEQEQNKYHRYGHYENKTRNDTDNLIDNGQTSVLRP